MQILSIFSTNRICTHLRWCRQICCDCQFPADSPTLSALFSLLSLEKLEKRRRQHTVHSEVMMWSALSATETCCIFAGFERRSVVVAALVSARESSSCYHWLYDRSHLQPASSEICSTPRRTICKRSVCLYVNQASSNHNCWTETCSLSRGLRRLIIIIIIR